jgi:hypothetical protein
VPNASLLETAKQEVSDRLFHDDISFQADISEFVISIDRILRLADRARVKLSCHVDLVSYRPPGGPNPDRRSPAAIDRQPVRTGNAQIRWSIDPNRRRVK